MNEPDAEMYRKLVAEWPDEKIVEHILYWRAKSDGITLEVAKDKEVQHLRRKIRALQNKVKATRHAAIEFMRGRAFDDMVAKKMDAVTGVER